MQLAGFHADDERLVRPEVRGDARVGFETRHEGRRCVFGHIGGGYDATRMHSSINSHSPFEVRLAFKEKQIQANVGVATGIEKNST